ncbi:peptide chain release factor N(5)-glutamine methyltransferase [Oscillatoria sp. FACHB-1406]|uniref:peptide chain release factor N(5)-glutamine methyltransferase n=1 Tax=Oscillatoria sp. FACHB-1406 TaxID=2692846 RepID=UPI0016821E29|nr:peptide chain release factor N(5)-glutamine methyltransferase [Oscillatoria sp. FACHB-1406]MBD2579499.1 peptide chain release factor N(5)-glutamine methyltransferase [Oscillatoria sp. FACHB-1406]
MQRPSLAREKTRRKVSINGVSSLLLVSGEELRAWYEEAKVAAIAAGISPYEVDWLIGAFSTLDRLALRLGISPAARIELQIPFPELVRLWQQRLQDCVPVQYLAGKTTWRHLQLKVTPDVLIPRPETELAIDLAIASRSTSLDPPQHWVDLGTGSGAIAIGLASGFPAATIHAVDLSPQALEIARENARNCGFEKNIKFYQGAWFEPLKHLKGQICGMVSNPPYIPTTALASLQPEVARHEPHLALDGGADGLDCLRILVDAAPDYLRSGGLWLVEMMAGQAQQVTALLEARGSYDNVQIFSDLAGIERFACAYRR